jgi:hypothetical protein
MVVRAKATSIKDIGGDAEGKLFALPVLPVALATAIPKLFPRKEYPFVWIGSVEPSSAS